MCKTGIPLLLTTFTLVVFITLCSAVNAQGPRRLPSYSLDANSVRDCGDIQWTY